MRPQNIVAALAASVGLVNGQSISDLPSCSVSCLVSAITATGCATTDLACSCGKSAQLASSALPCIAKACSAADSSKTNTVLEGICANAGVPITIGASQSSASSTAAPSSNSLLPATTSSAVATSSIAANSSVSSNSSAPETASTVPSSSTATASPSTSPTGIVTGSASQMSIAMGFLVAAFLCAHVIT